MEFIPSRIKRRISTEVEGIGKLRPHLEPGKRHDKYITGQAPSTGKLVPSLRAAIGKVGLKDGMTISSHHHLRNGDLVLPQVMTEITAMSIRDLTLYTPSLGKNHACLIDYIRLGVITGIETSGMRGELAEATSRECILPKPVVFRTHGGRARSIGRGKRRIDVAFIGAPCYGNMGNMNGCLDPLAFGSMGYAKTDARFAREVAAITDHLVSYPVNPISIPQTAMDCVVQMERIDSPRLISQEATRKTRNPVELAIADYASQMIIATGLVKNGFSYRAGSGGISLAVARYLKDYVKASGIKGSFALGGITSTTTEMLQEGCFGALLDVQAFDVDAVASIRDDPRRIEVDAEMYADPQAKENMANELDVVILSATEVDTNFNVNALTASDGVIMEALGGYPDATASANLAVVMTPLIRKRVPIIVDRVVTISTPDECMDVVVTEREIAINPQNPVLKARLIERSLPVYEIKELRDMAYRLTGKPEPPQYGDKVVGLVGYWDGTTLDVIHNVL